MGWARAASNWEGRGRGMKTEAVGASEGASEVASVGVRVGASAAVGPLIMSPPSVASLSAAVLVEGESTSRGTRERPIGLVLLLLENPPRQCGRVATASACVCVTIREGSGCAEPGPKGSACADEFRFEGSGCG